MCALEPVFATSVSSCGSDIETQISDPGNRGHDESSFCQCFAFGVSNKACARRGNPSAGPARGPAAIPSAEIDQAHRRGPNDAPADCLSNGLCCGHLGRSSGASQRLGRASFTHAATTGMRGPGVEPWCELHVRGGRGDSRSTRRTSKLAVGVLSWREPRPLQRSRVQWRASGYQGHQVVALAHSDQGCALVGLCLSMCEVGVRAGGVCG